MNDVPTERLVVVAALLAVLFGPTSVRAQEAPRMPKLVVPIVGHVTGVGGSQFRSDLKLYNPSSGVISGRFVFTPRNESASPTDTSITFEIPPFFVVTYEDIYARAFPGADGAARLTVVLDRGVRAMPLADTSTYTATSNGGELGQSPTVFLESDYSGVGVTLAGVLGKATERTNVFVMTGEQGVRIRWSYRDSFSRATPAIIRIYPANATFQFAVSDLLGFPSAPNASLEAVIEMGSARIASSPVNNTTNQGRWSEFKIVRLNREGR